MTKYNKPTWAQRFSDFINRVAPFDGNPLIQDSEHETVVGEDLGDSIVFGEAVEASINSPSSAFNVDFNTTDYYAIDTTGVGTTAFTITLQNLDSNRVGILNVAKKAGDTILFANGDVIDVLGNAEDQITKTVIQFTVRSINSTFIVSPSTKYSEAWTLIPDETTADFSTISSAYYRKYNGKVELKGSLVITSLSAAPLATVFTLPTGYIPSVTRVLTAREDEELGQETVLAINNSGGMVIGNGGYTLYIDGLSFYIATA